MTRKNQLIETCWVSSHVKKDYIICNSFTTASHVLRKVLFILKFFQKKRKKSAKFLNLLKSWCKSNMYIRHGSHLANLCQNLFTLRWISVIAGLCLVRSQVFPFGKNFTKRQNFKDAVVLGWSREIFEKLS